MSHHDIVSRVGVQIINIWLLRGLLALQQFLRYRMCKNILKFSHLHEYNIAYVSLPGQWHEESESVQTEDHLVAKSPGKDPSQRMWKWCAHHPDLNGCSTCRKVLYCTATDILNKGVQFTGRQHPPVWSSAPNSSLEAGAFLLIP
jgi:hypothetical protein